VEAQDVVDKGSGQIHASGGAGPVEMLVSLNTFGCNAGLYTISKSITNSL
jgi:hypothetical protein